MSLADWFVGRRAGSGLTFTPVAAYTAAQVVVGTGGPVLANAMFTAGRHLSTHHRATGAHWSVRAPPPSG